MIEVFQPPRITREETAYKMLFHVFAAFAALAVSMAGLFYSMAGDSRKNRDALHKVTSPETELWAIIVFAVFVLAAVYLSVAGGCAVPASERTVCAVGEKRRQTVFCVCECLKCQSKRFFQTDFQFAEIAGRIAERFE